MHELYSRPCTCNRESDYVDEVMLHGWPIHLIDYWAGVYDSHSRLVWVFSHVSSYLNRWSNDVSFVGRRGDVDMTVGHRFGGLVFRVCCSPGGYGASIPPVGQVYIQERRGSACQSPGEWDSPYVATVPVLPSRCRGWEGGGTDARPLLAFCHPLPLSGLVYVCM